MFVITLLSVNITVMFRALVPKKAGITSILASPNLVNPIPERKAPL